MNTNMKLWNSVCVTDPSAVKEITGKQYSGNSPKPYWLVQRATEVFGPCGTGWGMEVVSERFERLTESDVLHVALVRVWYRLDGAEKSCIEQMGQTKAVYMSKKGIIVDEDAPKKSVTDAMVKCLSYLGFAGDIFSGRWDDSRYVEYAREETARRESQEAVVEAIGAIGQSKDIEELQAHFKAAWSMYPQHKADLKAAYDTRKEFLTTKKEEAL